MFVFIVSNKNYITIESHTKDRNNLKRPDISSLLVCAICVDYIDGFLTIQKRYLYLKGIPHLFQLIGLADQIE